MTIETHRVLDKSKIENAITTEITSTGGLSSIKNTEDFFTGFTKPINRELMRVFKDVELVEHLGSGMGRILPVYGRDSFQITENFMRLVFYKTVNEASEKTLPEDELRPITTDYGQLRPIKS